MTISINKISPVAPILRSNIPQSTKHETRNLSDYRQSSQHNQRPVLNYVAYDLGPEGIVLVPYGLGGNLDEVL